MQSLEKELGFISIFHKLLKHVIILTLHLKAQKKHSNKRIYSQYVSLDDTYVRSRRPRFSEIEKARLKQLSGLSGNLEAKRAL